MEYTTVIENALFEFQFNFGQEAVRSAIQSWETKNLKIQLPSTPDKKSTLKEPGAPKKGAKPSHSDCSDCGSNLSTPSIELKLDEPPTRQRVVAPAPAGILYES
jgi:hypothetical protein